MRFWESKKILVTGGAGFLGKHVVNGLGNIGVKKDNILVPRIKDCDLRIQKNCNKVVLGIDIVIHIAARVGGIKINKERPGEMFYDNAIMGIQLMEAARQAGVKKFVAISSVCAYPKDTPIPFREVNLWNGYPEETSAAYGLAKKMLLVQSQAYRKQYGFNAICLLPVNLYGPGDNFDVDSGHVIAALIRKFNEAKKNGDLSVEVWGSGMATREFLYVKDAANGIIRATEIYNNHEPVNLGTGEEVTIKSLAVLIADLMNFNGKICWDRSKPDGQPRRCLDVSRAFQEFGFKAEISLKEGLKRTIDWYLEKKEKLCYL